MHSPHGNGYLDGALRSPKQRGSMRATRIGVGPGVRPVKGQAVLGAALSQDIPGFAIRGTATRGNSDGSRIDRGMNASVWRGTRRASHGHSTMEQGRPITRLVEDSAKCRRISCRPLKPHPASRPTRRIPEQSPGGWYQANVPFVADPVEWLPMGSRLLLAVCARAENKKTLRKKPPSLEGGSGEIRPGAGIRP